MTAPSRTSPPSAAPSDSLSEQERQELEAASKGYDRAASSLPDEDEARESDEDIRAKAGGNVRPKRRAEQRTGTSNGKANEKTSETRTKPEDQSGDEPRHGVTAARQKGMLPQPGTAAPPLDESEDTGDERRDVDPDSSR